jgi:acyl carrier protein
MTDPLTDAVRRLKGLQEDIERLKSEQDEEGEPRLFFVEDEFIAVANNLTLDSGGLEDDAVYNDATYQTTTVDLIERFRQGFSEQVSVADTQSLSSDGITEDAVYNQAVYQTTSVDAVDIVRDVTVNRAAVVDTQSLSSGGITEDAVYNQATYQTTSVDAVDIIRKLEQETVAVTDSQTALNRTPLTANGTYNQTRAGYQTIAYNA